MPDTPRVLSDLTAGWLAEQLSTQIDSIEVEEMSAGVGFMGQLGRVRLDSPDPEAPASVVVSENRTLWPLREVRIAAVSGSPISSASSLPAATSIGLPPLP